MSIRVVVPQIGQSIAEATIVKWFKKEGERVEKGEPLVEIGTDKINTEIPSPASGIVERLLVEEDVTVPVETEIALISGEAGEEAASVEPRPDSSVPHTLSISDVASRHSPLVRKLAEQYNVDLSLIKGTGAGGRVKADDVQEFINRRQAEAGNRPKRVPMSRMRKLIAQHMVASKRSTAELTTVFEIDMTSVAGERKKAKETLQSQYGVKLTYLPFVIAAVSNALRAFPILNSSIENDEIVYKQEINIGIAVAMEEGLIVPVIRNAGAKSVLALTRAAQDLSERARSKRMTAEDLEGGTFTITNPGVFGALMGTPIIHHPQVAILGLGAVVKRPVVVDDAIAIRQMAYFSLTYDHRAMDGASADGFLAHVKNTLENQCPSALE